MSSYSHQSVIDLKDVDFKRLGILNAKDRAKMIESLSKYNTTLRFQGTLDLMYIIFKKMLILQYFDFQYSIYPMWGLL